MIPEEVENCALGVATVIIHTLPQVERRLGLDIARKYYLFFEALLTQHGHLRRKNNIGHDWYITTHQSASYPFLLGLSSSTSTAASHDVHDSKGVSWPKADSSARLSH